MSEQRVAELLAKQDIREVLYRYCRGVDRRDYAMIRACYHPDAVDNHGEYLGDVDGFVAHVESNLGRFERTMHFLGNILVELDDDGTRARSEAYAIAYHRLPARREKPERDFVVGLRYVDDFETREGEWRIANRVCAFEWSRIDPVPEGSNRFTETFLMGRPAADDVVFAPSLDDLPR